ncbi:hypothetical protein C6513_13485, partial [Escherichia coli]|nr:hypothetical protein [Escherichia coli]
LRQKQKKLIMLPSETMIWQPEFTDKTLSRKPGAVHKKVCHVRLPYFDAVSAGVSVVALTCSPGRAFCRPLTMT